MGDLLRQGCQWLEQMRTAHCASQVTYRRGTDELSVPATIGKPDGSLEDQYGLRVGATMLDFLISAADLSSAFGRPQSGDQIMADGRVYEVLDLAGQGCWRWSGVPGITMRIHTKEVAGQP
jgi:hypothetical protein